MLRQHSRRLGKVLGFVRLPREIKLRRRNVGIAGIKVHRGAIEITRVGVVFRIFGVLTQLHKCARSPGAAGEGAAQIFDGAARLGPLLSVAIGQRDTE